ncbi:MAG TPA: hypothetical protein VFC21_02155 [Bryobacteraceae bacterium]|nr:hypothetical protein [Bryobacteraceae bacterium]
MRSAFGAVAVLVIWGFGADNVNFDAVKPGTAPPNWTFLSNRPADRARWEVRFDPSAPSRGNVLEKDGGGMAEADYPLAVFDKVICHDGDLSVKFRIDGGSRIRTAGLVWRFVDLNNYYLLHFSVDQRNIALLRVLNGKIEQIPVTSDKLVLKTIAHDIGVGQWYVTKVSFRGDHIRAFFGNRVLFDASDEGLMAAGKTGVWTRGRTMASFDDFRIDRKN